MRAERTTNAQQNLAERQKGEAKRQARLATDAQQTAEKQAVLALAAEDKAKEAASQVGPGVDLLRPVQGVEFLAADAIGFTGTRLSVPH